MSTKSKPSWPLEPVLEMDDIQGIAVPGFFKPHQTLLGVRYGRKPSQVADLKRWLADFAPSLASATETLHDRRGHRQSSGKKAQKRWPPLPAIGFSYQGLFDLTPGAAAIPSRAYKIGMPRRSGLLGDPALPRDAGHPASTSGEPQPDLDILIIIAGDDRASVNRRAAEVRNALAAMGLDVISQNGDVREDAPGHEHFGFDDGVSQPGIRGRASDDPSDFITDRYIESAEFPASALFGYPGQDLVWPGEFVIGYPQSGADPLIPGPASAATPFWTKNGAFLVYRRLRQDVGRFWQTMNAEAKRLATLPGFSGLTDDILAAKLVGRWPSGAPVSRTPAADNESLGGDKLANNHFRFDSDTPQLKLVDGEDTYPQAKADPVGTTCPLASHIRKVNTRDAPSDTGARSSTYERRLLRVGVPFGPSAKDRYADERPGDPERGLLFLSIQSSIEEQFEFLQARWMNDDSRPKSPSGNDMIVGQNAPAADGIRRCTLFGSSLGQAIVEASQQFVTATGGGYFFVPSIAALKSVIAAN